MVKIAEENLAEFIDAFCETGYFSVEDTDRILEAGREHGLTPKVHVNQFTTIGGVQVSVKHDALSVDHLEVMTLNDIEALKNTSTMPVALPSCSYFLSIPYLYFGLDIFLMITCGAIFNIGFNSLFLLYSGSFNRKRIDLNRSGFGNTQGTSAKQFIVIIPLMLFPMLVFWLFNKFIGGNSGYIAVAVIGILSLALKNYAMNFIEKKYIK